MRSQIYVPFGVLWEELLKRDVVKVRYIGQCRVNSCFKDFGNRRDISLAD